MKNSEKVYLLELENAELRQELDEVYAEPVWFSAKGDWLVIVALLALVGVAGYYAWQIWSH